MIKRTIVRYKDSYGYYRNTYFTKYIAENGCFVCTVDGEIVNPDAGNNTYKNIIKTKKDVSIKKEIDTKGDKEIIDYLEGGIDKYVQYIENYEQYRKAYDNNARLRKLISHFEAIC